MKRLAIITLIALLSGCATMDTANKIENWPAEKYYNEGRKAQTDGDYNTSLELFSELQIRYPFSPYSKLAPLEIAFARYKTDELELALQSTDQFMEFYPDHEGMDYALYLKGLTYSKLAEQSEIASQQIDTQNIRNAFKNLAELVKKHPDSQYQQDATKRLKLLRNKLAQHELNKAKILINEGSSEAAFDRVQYIIENYPGTQASNEAILLFPRETPSSGIIAPAALPKGIPIIEPAPSANDAATLDLRSKETKKAETIATEPGASIPVNKKTAIPEKATLDKPSTEISSVPAGKPIAQMVQQAPTNPKQTKIQSEEAVKSTPSTLELKQESWLLAQNPEHYTIQIAATSRIAWLEDFVKKNKIINNVAYYESTQQGTPWYSILYGNYDSVEEASDAVKELKSRIVIDGAWIRQFSTIQSNIAAKR